MQRYTRTPSLRSDEDPDAGYYARPLPFRRLSARSRLSVYQRPLAPLVFDDLVSQGDDNLFVLQVDPQRIPDSDSDSDSV